MKDHTFLKDHLCYGDVQFFTLHSGEVSVSIFLLWSFSIECPVFSLAILEIPLLEVFFRRVALSVNFLWDMLGTMSLYFVCFEFSHLLAHLRMESILLPYWKIRYISAINWMIYKNYISRKNLSGLDIYISLFFCFCFFFVFFACFYCTVGRFFILLIIRSI